MNNTKEATKTKSQVKVNTNKRQQQNQETKGAGQMNTRQSVGTETTGHTQGTSLRLKTDAVSSTNRLDFETSERKGRFQGPWYLNASLYPAVERLADLIENRQDSESGILSFRFINPDDVLNYAHHFMSIVEVKLQGRGGRENIWQFRIASNTNTESKADLKSTNIGWTTDKDGKLAPVYQYFKQNKDQDVLAKCDCGSDVVVPLNASSDCSCGAKLSSHVDGDDTVSVIKVNVDMEAIHLKAHGKAPKGKVMDVTTVETIKIPDVLRVEVRDVPKDVLILVLGFAQYAHGLNMHGVIAE